MKRGFTLEAVFGAISTPVQGLDTSSPTISGTGVSGQIINLAIDNTPVTSTQPIVVGMDGRWAIRGDLTDLSVAEFLPGFAEHVRTALGSILGEAGEKRISLGLAKDGSGIGGESGHMT